MAFLFAGSLELRSGLPHGQDTHPLHTSHNPLRANHDLRASLPLYDVNMNMSGNDVFERNSLPKQGNPSRNMSGNDVFERNSLPKQGNPLRTRTKATVDNAMRKTLDNSDLEKLYIPENEQQISSKQSNYRPNKQYHRSLSNDVHDYELGATNPIYSGLDPESPTKLIHLAESLHEESSTDPKGSYIEFQQNRVPNFQDGPPSNIPQVDDTIHSAAPVGKTSSSRRSSRLSSRSNSQKSQSDFNYDVTRDSNYDVSGLSSQMTYPWQREKGIQCSMTNAGIKPDKLIILKMCCCVYPKL